MATPMVLANQRARTESGFTKNSGSYRSDSHTSFTNIVFAVSQFCYLQCKMPEIETPVVLRCELCTRPFDKRELRFAGISGSYHFASFRR